MYFMFVHTHTHSAYSHAFQLAENRLRVKQSNFSGKKIIQHNRWQQSLKYHFVSFGLGIYSENEEKENEEISNQIEFVSERMSHIATRYAPTPKNTMQPL